MGSQSGDAIVISVSWMIWKPPLDTIASGTSPTKGRRRHTRLSKRSENLKLTADSWKLRTPMGSQAASQAKLCTVDPRRLMGFIQAMCRNVFFQMAALGVTGRPCPTAHTMALLSPILSSSRKAETWMQPLDFVLCQGRLRTGVAANPVAAWLDMQSMEGRRGPRAQRCSFCRSGPMEYSW